MIRLYRTYKSKKWVKHIVDKNSKTKNPIECEQYIHKTDKAALAALKAIPLFDKLAVKYYQL